MKVVICNAENNETNSLRELSSYFQKKIDSLSMNGWSVSKDVDGFEMVMYKGMVVDEIIHCVGELCLCENNPMLSDDYGEQVCAFSSKLLNDSAFSDEFYEDYLFLKDLIDAKFDDERVY